MVSKCLTNVVNWSYSHDMIMIPQYVIFKYTSKIKRVDTNNNKNKKLNFFKNNY